MKTVKASWKSVAIWVTSSAIEPPENDASRYTKTGSIDLSKPPDQIRTARTMGVIRNVKYRLKRKKRVSAWKLALDLEVSERSVRRIRKDSSHLKTYKKIMQLFITDDHRAQRVQFANWLRKIFVRRTRCVSFSRIRRCSTSMVSIIPRTNGCTQ